jgi:hypothetical protein
MRRTPAALALAAALLVGMLAPGGATATDTDTPRAPTPVLLERAVARGELARVQADRILAEALTDPGSIPAAYRSDAGWEGTPWLLALRDRLERMPPGPARTAIAEALGPTDNCMGLTGTSELDTPHFHIHYTGTTVPPIANYGASLEAAWAKEVDSFGWAAPPNWPGGKYLVVVVPTGNVFGFVTPTGQPPGGNNPNTPWNDQDAENSCMVLNSSYAVFGDAQKALDATTAHEFNHSIQFGYGALNGPNVPDHVFIEGGATWVEDEVFDESNDNYRYLWPDVADDMGEYRDNNPAGNPYSYWVVWRAMLERFGTGVAGGGERVMQRFWELTSRNEADNLDAMARALGSEGLTLSSAFHDAGISLRFNRACGGGYVPPFCLEEGPAYLAARGSPPFHVTIGSLPATFDGGLPDNYSLHWIALPTNLGPFGVTVKNLAGAGGRFRASVACDTGSAIDVRGLPGLAGPEETLSLRRFEPAGCQSAVALVANVAQTEDNPGSSQHRPYRLAIGPPVDRTRTTLRVRLARERVVAKGKLSPAQPGGRMRVTLFERDGRRWDRVDRDRARLKRGRRYRAVLDRPDATRCKVEARFKGDQDALPSRRARAFAC